MVGVDQAQIDKILSGASSEDPEARLDTLEKELDFVKTSIKRLLIDLRERMNELDNPFTSTAPYTGGRFEPPALPRDTDDDLLDGVPLDLGGQKTTAPENPGGLFPTDLAAACLPPESIPLLPPESVPPQEKSPGKLKLQKVHRLFAWVHQGCSKYGHEHMTIMIDAYRSMGYITDEVADQIREIMRMAPATRGDVAEIGPNEFVSELYVLNRILDPEDATLDRDMIEVLMLARRRSAGLDAGKPSSQERDGGDTWIELLDRI
ncbi:hypothetical protein [Methanoculleus sp. UBA430]|uniref:hypothetical protein n=1 Tax=Methanoculleus sp. UBA430 TaxID=1915511 RepID=UPI0025FB83A0|nr:hypothetical protein [Methanoculleus sp. UBA430]